MTTFKVIATNHTSFTVSDLDRSLAFFRDALGFEVTSKGPRSPSLIQAITGMCAAPVTVSSSSSTSNLKRAVAYGHDRAIPASATSPTMSTILMRPSRPRGTTQWSPSARLSPLIRDRIAAAEWHTYEIPTASLSNSSKKPERRLSD